MWTSRPRPCGRWPSSSLAELRRREQAGTDVAVSDLIRALGADAMHTINHPGNPVLLRPGRAGAGRAGRSRPVPERERTLLGTTMAPREPRVLEALGLPIERARTHWQHAGSEYSVEPYAKLSSSTTPSTRIWSGPASSATPT